MFVAVKKLSSVKIDQRDLPFVLERVFFPRMSSFQSSFYTTECEGKKSCNPQCYQERTSTRILDSNLVNSSNVYFSLRLYLAKYCNFISARL